MRILRRSFLKIVGAAATAVLGTPAMLRAQSTTAIQRKEFSMEIKRSGSQPSTEGPADWFTGTVRIDPLFQSNAPARTASHLNPAHALRGTRIRSDKRSSSQADAVGRNAQAVRSKKFGLAMSCGSRPTRSIGTAQLRQPR